MGIEDVNMRSGKESEAMLSLYFDESGNTGTNYLDVKQPYFVYGGWLIGKEKEDEICEGIGRIFCHSKAKELKSKNGLKFEKIKELFHMMLYEFHAIPVFGVADKRYMVAGKIIETFFDHLYNPNVNGYLTYRSQLKKSLADCVSKNDSLLVAFSKLIHDGTIGLEEMRNIKEALSNHFEKENLLDVQKTISDLSDASLLEMIKEFEDVSKNGIEKRWLTLVGPILIDRILHVDIYAGLIGEKVDLYIDELWGYQNVFEEIRDILDRKRLIKNVKFIKQCKSDESLLIQAADLLCGFVFNTLIENEVVMKNEIVNEIWQDFIFISNVFKRYNIKIWDYYAHSDFEYEILYLGGYTGPKKKVDSNKIILREFQKAIE